MDAAPIKDINTEHVMAGARQAGRVRGAGPVTRWRVASSHEELQRAQGGHTVPPGMPQAMLHALRLVWPLASAGSSTLPLTQAP